MSEPIADEPKVRLVANVILRDPVTGRPVTFGPDSEDVPKWARDTITNPGAWGLSQPRRTGPATNIGHEDARDDRGRPNFIDVICSTKHRQRTLARFETTTLVAYRPGRDDDDANG